MHTNIFYSFSFVGAEPEWVQAERDMFKENRDKDGKTRAAAAAARARRCTFAGDGLLNREEMREW